MADSRKTLTEEDVQGMSMDSYAKFRDNITFSEPFTEGIYRERARLVSFLTKIFPSYCGFTDPEEPDWLIVYVETQEGQLSWHISPDDADLFGHLILVQENRWDGHTTKEKYERLARLGRRFRRNPATVDTADSLYKSFGSDILRKG